ncbi:MAG: hypothetical protein V4514_05560 [Pseudomonadota bacterium]|uniref:hypothetical protein n=1 Tax=Phenylobacterium sp. TaxID=1871053 RepID=UPI0025D349CB|nr:hypothetical protein [Phenylobacterium sp.]MBT9470220.1 hypothetical protein [Phenylobacterium sp.]
MPRDDVAHLSSDGAPTAPVSLIGRLLTLLLQGMPLIFGIGFIAPLMTQLLDRALPGAAQAEWPLVAGLAIGGSWGAVANLTGRWL